MRITEKGQVTIPLELREKHHFLPNTEVEFVEEKGRLYIKKVIGKKSRGNNIINHLRGRGTVRMTTDEILALTRGKK